MKFVYEPEIICDEDDIPVSQILHMWIFDHEEANGIYTTIRDPKTNRTRSVPSAWLVETQEQAENHFRQLLISSKCEHEQHLESTKMKLEKIQSIINQQNDNHDSN